MHFARFDRELVYGKIVASDVYPVNIAFFAYKKVNEEFSNEPLFRKKIEFKNSFISMKCNFFFFFFLHFPFSILPLRSREQKNSVWFIELKNFSPYLFIFITFNISNRKNYKFILVTIRAYILCSITIFIDEIIDKNFPRKLHGDAFSSPRVTRYGRRKHVSPYT